MKTANKNKEEQVLDPMRTSETLQGTMEALVEAAKKNGEIEAKTPEALVQGSNTLPCSTTAATPEGAFTWLPDSRGSEVEVLIPHPALLFSVAPSEGTVLDELKMLLGEDAANQLDKDWQGWEGSKTYLDRKLEATDVALFLEENMKPKTRDYARSGEQTTQEEDLNVTDNQVASNLAAILLCARIFRKAQDEVSLSEGEQDLYQKLVDGVLLSCTGALVIREGRLCLNDFYGSRDSNFWALLALS